MSDTEVCQAGASASNGHTGNKRATVSGDCEEKINGFDGILPTKRVCTELQRDDKPVARAKGSQTDLRIAILYHESICLACELSGNTQPGDLNKKRTDYLEWPDYFMAIAFLSAQRSKDPSSQVGACIVNEQKKIVGIGYNGMPRGCSDDVMPWRRTANDKLQTKYLYVCHAEMNAILNKNSADVENCTIYVALFPCNECAKLIIQSGIKEVVYLSDKYHDMAEFIASRKMMDHAKVKYRQYTPKMSQILIDFGAIGPSTTGGPSKEVNSAAETNNNGSKDT